MYKFYRGARPLPPGKSKESTLWIRSWALRSFPAAGGVSQGRCAEALEIQFCGDASCSGGAGSESPGILWASQTHCTGSIGEVRPGKSFDFHAGWPPAVNPAPASMARADAPARGGVCMGALTGVQVSDGFTALPSLRGSSTRTAGSARWQDSECAQLPCRRAGCEIRRACTKWRG